MPLNLELRIPFDSSDKPSDAERAIIHKHLEALSAELGEEVYVAAFLNSRFYPDTLYIDGEDSPYELVEGREAMKEERRKAKVNGMKQAKLARRAIEECGLKP